MLAGVLLLSAAAAACEQGSTNAVSGVDACLQVRAFGATDLTQHGSLLIWLHGDTSSGGPAIAHFAIAQRAAQTFADAGVVSVAIVRPGYPADNGSASSSNNYDRSDSYTGSGAGGLPPVTLPTGGVRAAKAAGRAAKYQRMEKKCFMQN